MTEDHYLRTTNRVGYYAAVSTAIITVITFGFAMTAVQWIFIASFVLVILSLAVITFIYGLERLDRFEVFAVSINWLVLIINGVILSIIFRRQLKTP